MDFFKNRWVHDTFATWSPVKKISFILFLWGGILILAWHLQFKKLLASINRLKQEVTILERDQKQAVILNKRLTTIQNVDTPFLETSLVTILDEISKEDIKLIEYKKIKHKRLEQVFDISLQSSFDQMINLFEKLTRFRIIILKSDLKRIDDAAIRAMLRISVS